MQNEIIENGDVVYYAVKVNGTIVSPRYATPSLAEAQIEHLAEPHRLIAEVVRITADGKEILFG